VRRIVWLVSEMDLSIAYYRRKTLAELFRLMWLLIVYLENALKYVFHTFFFRAQINIGGTLNRYLSFALSLKKKTANFVADVKSLPSKEADFN